MNKKAGSNIRGIFGFFLIACFVGMVIAYPILDAGIRDYLNEDESPSYNYNFTKNVTGTISGDLHFSLYEINSPQFPSFDVNDFYWISINSSSGVMLIDSTRDNETGNFNISVQVVDDTAQGTTVASFFDVNATNDAPVVIANDQYNLTYNMTQAETFLEYLNATDEEEHYPLSFNLTFLNNCTLASWSGRTNCSLFDLSDLENTSALMNHTPSKDDVGVYYANLTVTDAGENYNCPHVYCDNLTYEQNQTTYSGLITFNVFSSLGINVTDCQNKIFQEGEANVCYINITTRGETDNLNISSSAEVRNYVANVANSSWFYSNQLTSATDFIKTVEINITPEKTEIGNWTIFFNVFDETSLENKTEEIFIYVNRTSNDAPDLFPIENVSTSVNLNTRIDLEVFDDDLLIPDKLEGYNETIDFSVEILNASNLGQSLSISGFDVEILSMPVSGTNKTTAKIEFNPSSAEAGEYTINITVGDKVGELDFETFNLTILDNEAPQWTSPLQTTFILDEGDSLYLNFTQNSTDPDGDVLTFSYSGNNFTSFNLDANTGVTSFTAVDKDVGTYLIDVTLSDGYLTNRTTFNFTINNVNDPVSIQSFTSNTPNSTYTANSVTTSEDNLTIIYLTMQDDDLRIPQKNFYNENLDFNFTILNSSDMNIDLFNFTLTSIIDNLVVYTATFTPGKEDIGVYNVTVNVTDQSNSSDLVSFNLTINEINHNPSLSSVSKQISAVNRTFYYDFNATDSEDGTDLDGNLTYWMVFDSGANFINNNETIFNSTTGVLEIIFNDSQSGKYNLTLFVNDSSGSESNLTFELYVYGGLDVDFPASSYIFSLSEGISSNLTFNASHSVADNLTYEFYIDDVLRNNLTYFGNSTPINWTFTPNYTDETYGFPKNLTLFIYPTNENLTNNKNVNFTVNWNLSIAHENYPINFSGYIGDKQSGYNQVITIDLKDYFTDYDHDDVYYNQTVNFTINSDAASSLIKSSGSSVSEDWVLTLKSLGVATELLTISATDGLNISSTNSFEVVFTEPEVVTRTSSGGGGGNSRPVSLKIIMPEPVEAKTNERMEIPIELYNSGKARLSQIDLSGFVMNNFTLAEGLNVSFDIPSISSLDIGDRKNITMYVDVGNEIEGVFEITVNATVRSPKYEDWGKMYFTVTTTDEIQEKMVFVETFLLENPECAELTELVEEAKGFFKQGDFVATILKIDEAIDACKKIVAQPKTALIKEQIQKKIYFYVLVLTASALFVGMSYYYYRKYLLKKYAVQKELFDKKQKNQRV